VRSPSSHSSASVAWAAQHARPAVTLGSSP
jgi:hypothetical protein